ncbi:hypothetical protein LX32DRAFT_318570 [Colletotrichum zoysiae]|uniref:Nephrocystin 3-like N-terminal domain-containing protein n=1 Tax=Colletotrichum zoysiae TaxID=1216348 RepID=A0AAD9M2M9_9PEZI|nr:hypothetical protein LX32DRAFT_318570 [Colletotrichum zoysiae]
MVSVLCIAKCPITYYSCPDQGNPGWGKTVLAASVTEELLGEAIEGSSNAAQIGYFFFRYDTPGNTTMEAAYRSILTQVLHRNQRYNPIN